MDKEYNVGIVVLTKGVERKRDKWRSNLDARLNIAAAARRYQRYKDLGYKPFLILSGGQIDKNQPVLSKIMRKEALEYGVDDNDIELEDRSIDTSENAEYSLPFTKMISPDGKLEVVTNLYHLERSRTCFKIHGMDPTMVSSESELLSAYPKDIKAYLASNHVKERFRTHKMYHLVLKLFGEKPFRWYAHQLVDKKGGRKP